MHEGIAMRATTLAELEGMTQFLREQGATDGTSIFISSDDEGNNFQMGIDVAFSPDENFRVTPWDEPNFETAGGSITFFPSGPQAELLWQE